MNFTAVLRDIRAMQQDREDDLASLRQQRDELVARVRRANTRLIYADLDIDRRYWSQSECDELASAEEELDEARRDLNAFLATHAKDLT